MYPFFNHLDIYQDSLAERICHKIRYFTILNENSYKKIYVIKAYKDFDIQIYLSYTVLDFWHGSCHIICSSIEKPKQWKKSGIIF